MTLFLRCIRALEAVLALCDEREEAAKRWVNEAKTRYAGNDIAEIRADAASLITKGTIRSVREAIARELGEQG